MEFSIGSQFSREISFEESRVVDDLGKQINACISNKEYHALIKKVYVGVICVSAGFEPFFMARPLKILRKEPAIEYELKLDFETFFNAQKEERVAILRNEFLNQSKEILNNTKLKNFKFEEFFQDLENCLLPKKS